MKRIITLVLVFVLLIAAGLYAKRKFYDPKQRLENATKQVAKLAENHEIREGDLIFQTSLSWQSMAIQLATHSQYSHCGIIHLKGNDYFVFEAVEPVKWTSLNNRNKIIFERKRAGLLQEYLSTAGLSLKCKFCLL